MAKDFKGIVKISDIQNEFDNIVSSINDSVDEYNNMEGLKDIDYNKAGSTLAQLGYTLTIGGLKQFMQIYNGYCFGCRVFKTSTNQCKPTGGILVTEDRFYRIPTDLVNGYGTMLFYNPKTNKCQVGGAAKVWKSWTQPKITSNNSFGSFFASHNTGIAWKSTGHLDKNNPNDALKNIWAGGSKKETTAQEIVYVGWKFPARMKLSKISFTFGWACLYPQARAFGVRVRDLSNNAIISESYKLNGGPFAIYDYNIPLSNKTLSGIKIELISKVTSAKSALALLSDLKISGQLEQWQGTGEIPDDLIKIADLNWKKTTNDKLWLNDLPHSMY